MVLLLLFLLFVGAVCVEQSVKVASLLLLLLIALVVKAVIGHIVLVEVVDGLVDVSVLVEPSDEAGARQLGCAEDEKGKDEPVVGKMAKEADVLGLVERPRALLVGYPDDQLKDVIGERVHVELLAVQVVLGLAAVEVGEPLGRAIVAGRVLEQGPDVLADF